MCNSPRLDLYAVSKRSTKELFEIMLENQHLYDRGICMWLIKVWASECITCREYGHLRDYLYYNLPVRNIFGFCWEVNKIEPRIEWIKSQIEKL